MAIAFGWKVNDERESIWKDDDALKQPLPSDVIAAWEQDGDASHLRPFLKPGGKPTIIRFRGLTRDETAHVTGLFDRDNELTALAHRMWLRCFRIGVRFDGIEEVDGKPVVTREFGIRQLAGEFVQSLDPQIVWFYGRLIQDASFPTAAEKKASSPQSTTTPSAATAQGNTADATAPPADPAMTTEGAAPASR